jgi:rhodanese-related sulfurtransferase
MVMSKKKKNTQSSASQARSGKQVKESKKNYTWLIAGLATVVVLIIAGFVFLNNVNTPTEVAANIPMEISVDEAAVKRDQGAFILDVRQPEEWQEYHVPGSTLIPLDQLASRLDEVPKDQEIVVVCRSGNRSQEGRDILRNADFSNVTSMAGGLTEWAARGYETVSGP